MSEVQETRKPNRFRVTSIIIALMIIATSIMFLIPSQKTDSIPAHTLVVDTHTWNAPTLHFSANRSTTPILSPNNATWENDEFADTVIIEESNHLRLYFSAFSSAYIGLATSPLSYPPTTWTKYAGNPIIDSADVPGGTRLGSVFKDNGTYYMYLGQGVVSTAVLRATSTDGINFTGFNSVLTPSGDEITIEDASVIRATETEWYMYYAYRTTGSTLPGLRVANSTDGITWTKVGDVLTKGVAGTWDDTYIEHHQIIVIDGYYLLVYEGYGGSGNEPWCTGIAYSTNPLGTFTKYISNPIFRGSGVPGQFDRYHVDCPFIFSHTGTNYLFYGGSPSFDYGTWRWCLGLTWTDESLDVWTHSTNREATTSANWKPAEVPTTGDSIIFDSTSDTSMTLNIIGNPSLASLTVNNGYCGKITQTTALTVSSFTLAGYTYVSWYPSFKSSADVTVNGNVNLIGGTLDATGTRIWTVSGDVVRTNGALNFNTIQLIMTGNGKTLAGGSGLGITFGWKKITFNENTTVTGDFVRSASNIIIASGKTVTIAANSRLVFDSWAGTITNNGIINGPGWLTYEVYLDQNEPMPGTVNSGFELYAEPSMATNRIITMATNWIIGGAFKITGGGSGGNKMITLTHGSNYTLNVAGHVETGQFGKLTQGSGVWNLGHLLTSVDKGTLTLSNINMPIGHNLQTSWSAFPSDPSAIVNFTLSGLESGGGILYNVYVDGDRIAQLRPDGAGTISFTYSGPWSEHTFEVVRYDPWGPLYDMGPVMLYIGVIVGLTAIVLVMVGSRIKLKG